MYITDVPSAPVRVKEINHRAVIFHCVLDTTKSVELRRTCQEVEMKHYVIARRIN